MALTPTILNSQLDVGVVSSITNDVNISQLGVLAVYSFPSERVIVSQFDVGTVGYVQSDVLVSQLDVSLS